MRSDSAHGFFLHYLHRVIGRLIVSKVPLHPLCFLSKSYDYLLAKEVWVGLGEHHAYHERHSWHSVQALKKGFCGLHEWLDDTTRPVCSMHTVPRIMTCTERLSTNLF